MYISSVLRCDPARAARELHNCEGEATHSKRRADGKSCTILQHAKVPELCVVLHDERGERALPDEIAVSQSGQVMWGESERRTDSKIC